MWRLYALPMIDGVEMQPLPEGMTKWWGKAFLFKAERLHDFDTVVYLDLDQIITGPLDALFELQCPFSTLSTATFWCELSNTGYNSSVIVWQPKRVDFAPLFDALVAHAEIRTYVHRFDHYLEMVLPVGCSDSIQDRLGRNFVVDWAFLWGATENHVFDDGVFRARDGVEPTFTPPVEGVSIVTFPRTPPAKIDNPWVKERWASKKCSREK